jgi:hypothetical protein
MMSPDFDVSVPNVARIYDYLLGGKDNYLADRDAARELQQALPDIAVACRENREFLGRVVRFLVGEAGIRQIIDIGTGLPTMMGNVHEIAQGVRPQARVVYVDYDPVVVGHARALLATSEHVAAVRSDLRTPRELITHPDMRKMIDFSKPVAVLILATLHFITDEEHPYDLVGVLRAAVAPGSYLAISHATHDGVDRDDALNGMAVYEKASAPVVPRHYGEVLGFFDGMTLVSPGLVGISQWRSEPRHRTRHLIYGGVARKERHGA